MEKSAEKVENPDREMGSCTKAKDQKIVRCGCARVLVIYTQDSLCRRFPRIHAFRCTGRLNCSIRDSRL